MRESFIRRIILQGCSTKVVMMLAIGAVMLYVLLSLNPPAPFFVSTPLVPNAAMITGFWVTVTAAMNQYIATNGTPTPIVGMTTTTLIPSPISTPSPTP